eukprot:PhM_4_TR2433/c0_g1_i1/m.78537
MISTQTQDRFLFLVWLILVAYTIHTAVERSLRNSHHPIVTNDRNESLDSFEKDGTYIAVLNETLQRRRNVVEVLKRKVDRATTLLFDLERSLHLAQQEYKHVLEQTNIIEQELKRVNNDESLILRSHRAAAAAAQKHAAFSDLREEGAAVQQADVLFGPCPRRDTSGAVEVPRLGSLKNGYELCSTQVPSATSSPRQFSDLGGSDVDHIARYFDIHRNNAVVMHVGSKCGSVAADIHIRTGAAVLGVDDNPDYVRYSLEAFRDRHPRLGFCTSPYPHWFPRRLFDAVLSTTPLPALGGPAAGSQCERLHHTLNAVKLGGVLWIGMQDNVTVASALSNCRDDLMQWNELDGATLRFEVLGDLAVVGKSIDVTRAATSLVVRKFAWSPPQGK